MWGFKALRRSPKTSQNRDTHAPLGDTAVCHKNPCHTFALGKVAESELALPIAPPTRATNPLPFNALWGKKIQPRSD